MLFEKSKLQICLGRESTFFFFYERREQFLFPAAALVCDKLYFGRCVSDLWAPL